MIRTPGGGGPHPPLIIQGLPVMETPCIHARVAPHALFFGANGSSRYIVCHLCREGAGAHLVVAKGTEGRWRYLAFRLVFTLEGGCLRARVANDDAPLAPPADSREVRLVVGEDGDPALLTVPKDDRRAIHTPGKGRGGRWPRGPRPSSAGSCGQAPPRIFPRGDAEPTGTRPSD